MFTFGYQAPQKRRAGLKRRGILRGFFRDQGGRDFSGLRSHDLHLVPVVLEFLAAVEARDIGASAFRGRAATRTRANCDGKTVASVPASKHGVHQPRKHCISSTEQSDKSSSSLSRQHSAISSTNLDSC